MFYRWHLGEGGSKNHPYIYAEVVMESGKNPRWEPLGEERVAMAQVGGKWN